MNPTLKNILVVVAAILAGFICLWIGHMISFKIIPLPPGLDMNKPDTFVANAHLITAGGWALAVLSHALGPLVSGYITAKFAANQHRRLVHIVGIVWTIIGIQNLYTIPSPLWFMIADVCVYIPMSVLGGRLARNPL
jgi:hypothetical protein